MSKDATHSSLLKWVLTGCLLMLPVSMAWAQQGSQDGQEFYDPLNPDSQVQAGKLVLPGRVQQEQPHAAAAESMHTKQPREPLHDIGPAPQWTNQPPVFESNIPVGAVFSVALTSPLHLGQLRPGDYIEFETVTGVTSGDGRWQLPAGSKVNARVSTLVPSERSKRKGRLGITFYEVITPDGWVIPFSGSLLAYPSLKKNAMLKQDMALMLENTPPTGMEGVMIVPMNTKNKASSQLETGHLFAVRVGQALYFGPTTTHQQFASQQNNAMGGNSGANERGVVPVRHFSKDASVQIEQYQDENLMPLPYTGFIGDE